MQTVGTLNMMLTGMRLVKTNIGVLVQEKEAESLFFFHTSKKISNSLEKVLYLHL
jgi:hypothetical protein